MEIACLDPVVIVNPSIHDFISGCDKLVFNKYTYSIDGALKASVLNGNNICSELKLPKRVDKSFVDLCYFVDSRTGETFPLYNVVPCCHCSLCLKRKVSSYIQRCQFQSLEQTKYLSLPPLMVTLTYNNSHLPVDGVQLRDVQLFKKRLNRLLHSIYSFDFHLKFICCSEYGKTGRAHYHLLIFNFPAPYQKVSHPDTYIKVLRFLQYCWRERSRMNFKTYLKQNYHVFYQNQKNSDSKSIGFVNCSPARSSKAVSYILKYFSKGSNVPEGKKDTFLLTSCNLGVGFAYSLRDCLLASKDNKVKFLDYSTGNVVETQLVGYYIKKLFPSFSNLVPRDLRKHIRNFHYLCEYGLQHNFLDDENKRFFLSSKVRVSALFPFYDFCTLYFDRIPHKFIQKRFSIFEPAVIPNSFPSYAIPYTSALLYVVDDYNDFYRSFFDSYKYIIEHPLSFKDYDRIKKQLIDRDIYLSRIKDNPDNVINKALFDREQGHIVSLSKL